MSKMMKAQKLNYLKHFFFSLKLQERILSLETQEPKDSRFNFKIRPNYLKWLEADGRWLGLIVILDKGMILNDYVVE